MKRRGFVALVAALGTLAVLAPAGASGAAPQLLTQFGTTGSGAGQTRLPRGIGDDPETGHVFVADLQNARIDEFTAWGEFVKAFGWDVAPGAVDEEQEVRIRATAGEFRLSFGAETTPDLPFDAGAAEVQAALNGLASIGAGGVSVSGRKGADDGTAPYIYVVAFDGEALDEGDVAQLLASNGSAPLSGGNPASGSEVRTRANGTPGGDELESCTAASGCQMGIESVSINAGAGQITSPFGIAVDSSGAVYEVDWEHHRVQKFASDGGFLLMIGGGVNKTKVEEGAPEAERNLCTAASGDVCQAGSVGSGKGQFDQPAIGSFIAVGATDTVYVGDKERIQKFNPDGTYDSAISLAGKGTPFALALAPSGNVFVSYAANVSEAKAPVEQLDPAGALICSIGAEAVKRPEALATDSAGNAYVFSVSDDKESTEIREFGPDCEEVGEPFAIRTFEKSTGIATNAVGDVYVGNAMTVNSYINAYGPSPLSYESPAPLAPQIIAQYALSVEAEAASVQAQINPHFWTDATYYLQYGTAACLAGGWEAACVKEQPTAPGLPLTTSALDASVQTAAINLVGLTPATTYLYRFAALSGGGGPAFGPDRSFHTFPEDPLSVADERVSELVSPLNKGGGEVATPTPAGGAAELTVQPQQSSPSGDAITYASATPFGEGPESAPGASQYISHRNTDGTWSTDNINPPFNEGFLRDPIVGFSTDLSHAAAIVPEPELTTDAAIGVQNIYWRDNAASSLSALTTEVHHPQVKVGVAYCLYYGGTSADSTRVFFAAKAALLEGDPVAKGFNLYEWSLSDGLRLVSMLPGEAQAPATPTTNTSFGGRGRALEQCDPSETLMRHAISADGSRAIWTYEGSIGTIQKPLLDRVNGTETIQLDAPNEGTPGKGGEGLYWDASTAGSKVFFTTTKKLTSTSTTAGSSDLYLYDFDKEAGERLTDLTAHVGEAADVKGVLGASPDGDYAYFVATGVLDTGATSGKNNLYAWHEGDGVRFLATLSDGLSDTSDWATNPDIQTARVSPNGTTVAFLSVEDLTGFDNAGEAEAFLYDYEADTLDCASCNPSGSRPLGAADLPSWSTPYEQPRYLSEDGERLFFETLDSLDPHDTNEVSDVYEFERPGVGSCKEASPTYNPDSNGCLYLISSGQSTEASYFLDASSSGDDAFISTREGLIYTDKDGRYDVYDAKVGGNPPPPPPQICEGEGCRNQGTSAPAPSAPGTAAFQGPADPTPKRGCPKGRREVVQKGKARCVKAKRHQGKKQTTRQRKRGRQG